MLNLTLPVDLVYLGDFIRTIRTIFTRECKIDRFLTRGLDRYNGHIYVYIYACANFDPTLYFFCIEK